MDRFSPYEIGLIACAVVFVFIVGVMIFTVL